MAEYFVNRVESVLGGDISFIEPSAGTGVFVDILKDKCVKSFDLDPHHPSTIEKDFLKTSAEDFEGVGNFIGNPPFGKNSSLAVKFFNHCANNGDSVSFILPRTFKKIFFQEKLHPYMHLVFEEGCPRESFILNGEKYDVPCVMQIWVKKEVSRESPTLKENVFWEVVDNREDADLFIRRVGGRAGKVLDKEKDPLTPSTTFFLKKRSPYIDKMITDAYSQIREISSHTAGVKSISLKEIQYVLEGKTNEN